MAIASSLWCRLICCCALVLLAGCGGSPHRPAPVTGVDFYSKYQKGSYRGSTYKVSRGETLYAISWRTGVSVESLARLNRIDSSYTIYPGQLLRLHSASSPSPAPQRKVPTTTPVSRQPPEPVKKTPPEPASNHAKKTVAPAAGKEYAGTTAQKISSSQPQGPITRWLWPTTGRVVKGFSATGQGNKGIDIAGKAGQPIYATADGKVVYAGGALRGYGQLIIVKHNDDYLSAYAHNQDILVREQQRVKAGQKIATMGSSGSSDVRLHFEIRLKGQSVNPLRYLPRQ